MRTAMVVEGLMYPTPMSAPSWPRTSTIDPAAMPAGSTRSIAPEKIQGLPPRTGASRPAFRNTLSDKFAARLAGADELAAASAALDDDADRIDDHRAIDRLGHV